MESWMLILLCRWFRRQARDSSVVILLLLLGTILMLLSRISMKNYNNPQYYYSSILLEVRNSVNNEQKNEKNPKKKKKVKVFLLMGQSNMVGFGKVTGDAKKKYPFFATTNDNDTSKLSWKRTLHNDEKSKIEEEDNSDTNNNNSSKAAFHYFQRRVRYVFTSGSGGPEKKIRIENNQWLTMKNRNYIGPEIGIGYELGMAIMGVDNNNYKNDDNDDILLLKTCVGNRALGWDLLPPGSPGFEVEEDDYHGRNDNTKTTTTWRYAGYHQSPQRWKVNRTGRDNDYYETNNSTNVMNDTTTNSSWYSGHQYDGDVFRAKSVLQNLTHYMGYGDDGDDVDVDDDDNEQKESEEVVEVEYEIIGIFFWQGDRDVYNKYPGYASRYGKNLENLVTALRVDFKAPKAKFVLATLGQTPAINDNSDNNNNNEKENENTYELINKTRHVLPTNFDEVDQRNTSRSLKKKNKQQEQRDKEEKALRLKVQERLVFNAQMELPKQPRFVGNTATVYSFPLVRGRPDLDKTISSTNHYKKSLEIYMNVGLAMGQAMIDLLAHSDDNNINDI